MKLEKIVSTVKKGLRTTILIGASMATGYYVANEVAKHEKFNESDMDDVLEAILKVESVYCK